MRTLHVDSGREMRGGQMQVLRLIDGLLARGVECRLLARDGSPLYREACRRGWNVSSVGWARVAIESRRYDLVHAHDARSHTLAVVSGGGALVVARRVAFPIHSDWKYRRAHRFIAVSRHVAGVLQEGGVAPDRIAIVHDGVPPLDPLPVRSGVIAPANAADPRKGAALAAEAAALAGVDLQFSNNLERDLPGAAVLLYLTYTEGLGSAILLGMASGAAVIASRVGGIPEAVQDCVTGLLVDGTPQSAAAALERLIADPDLARSLGARAREAAARDFSIDNMVEGTLNVYREVLSGERPERR